MSSRRRLAQELKVPVATLRTLERAGHLPAFDTVSAPVYRDAVLIWRASRMAGITTQRFGKVLRARRGAGDRGKRFFVLKASGATG